jgi:hypothetical protein
MPEGYFVGQGDQSGLPNTMTILEMVAGQISLLQIQRKDRIRISGYSPGAEKISAKSMMVCQTPGFLKLQAAQIRNYLGNEDYACACRAWRFRINLWRLPGCPQAIDGPRVVVVDNNFRNPSTNA